MCVCPALPLLISTLLILTLCSPHHLLSAPLLSSSAGPDVLWRNTTEHMEESGSGVRAAHPSTTANWPPQPITHLQPDKLRPRRAHAWGTLSRAPIDDCSSLDVDSRGLYARLSGDREAVPLGCDPTLETPAVEEESGEKPCARPLLILPQPYLVVLLMTISSSPVMTFLEPGIFISPGHMDSE
ncbi:hypothetical protein BKA65DRAFT_561691 [Rhexocercosporidium sp. MPI-PUGE-AT-0058]|nr:hypothetical protein BKA65DRAFT_561691 [Rhexocercosporidium sp. MPI-PUGE-AT-0058]